MKKSRPSACLLLLTIVVACSACSKNDAEPNMKEDTEEGAMLERIDHNQVPVVDLDKSVDWYVNLLGFKLVDRPNDDLAVLSLASGSTLLLWKSSDETRAHFVKNGETTPVIFFETKDIEKLQERLINHDVEIASFTDEGFAKFMRFYDINGNMFGVTENAGDKGGS